MSKYYILDEQNKPLILTNTQLLQKMNLLLENGLIENQIIKYEDTIYEYIELDGKEKIQILKDITSYYKKLQDNQRMFEMIEKLQKENKLLKKDNLTKLYRADYAMKLVRKYILWAKENDIDFSIVMADIDKFKNINDTYGHEFGNKVLEQIGITILNNVKINQKKVIDEKEKNFYNGEDIIIRYGGEEFLILYKDITLEDTINKVENLRREISEIDVNGINITMSFGINNIKMTENLDEIDENNIYKNTSKMVELADKALYYSKENGRNITSYYDFKNNSCETIKIYTKK